MSVNRTLKYPRLGFDYHRPMNLKFVPLGLSAFDWKETRVWLEIMTHFNLLIYNSFYFLNFLSHVVTLGVDWVTYIIHS